MPSLKIILGEIEYNLAKIISFLGHPLILGSVAALYVNFTQFSFQMATKLSMQLFLLCILPILIFISYQIYRGNFKDFDVSDQLQRNKLYTVLFFILTLQCIFVFIQDYGWVFTAGSLTVAAMLGVFLFVNRYLKISLHTSFAFLLATLSIEINGSLAFTLYLCAVLILFSRIVLKRHTLAEVAFGALGGLIFGGMFHILIQ